VNLAVVGSFVVFILCLVADFHEISNRFFKFLWDGCELQMNVVARPQGVWNVEHDMQNAIENELELGGTDYTVIDGLPVMVNTMRAGQKPGTLKVRPVRTGNIVTVEVYYDASPFADMPKPESFFLNQGELDDYMVKGPQFVLEAKRN